jgi:hypothetical protein
MNDGFKRRGKKSPLSEAEIEAKTAEFASKADAPTEVDTKTAFKSKTAQRDIRFTVRMNEAELEQLEKICIATGLNKVVAVRQALREYAKKIITE